MSKMAQTDLINATTSEWDGRSKSFTEQCGRCEFYRNINDEDRCYWGIAYKVLDRTKTLSYCQSINKPSPRKQRLR
jgi:hypothetical protein